ncbi:MAG TPA: hypothetical protein VGH00_09210 [Chthoniobacterales bacterium]
MRGFLAPSRIDPAVAKKINASVDELLNSDSMRSFLAAQGAEPLITSSEQFSEMLKSGNWAKVVEAADIRFELIARRWILLGPSDCGLCL